MSFTASSVRVRLSSQLLSLIFVVLPPTSQVSFVAIMDRGVRVVAVAWGCRLPDPAPGTDPPLQT